MLIIIIIIIIDLIFEIPRDHMLPRVKKNNNNNNNIHICIAPYSRNFRGAGARQCASESEKRKDSRHERRGMSLA